MKKNISNNKRSGFTLIEMVGVLAVIAILAALLVPKIFAAINDSRFSNTVATINSCKAATMSYFGKNSKFPAAGATTFDTTLVTDGFLESPLTCKVGTAANAQVLALANAGGAVVYKLDGTKAIVGDSVVEVKLTGVSLADARELSRRIDGESTATPSLTTTEANKLEGDVLGRVIYAKADPTVVYIYLADK